MLYGALTFRLVDRVFVKPPEGGEGVRTKLEVGDICISITADLGIIGVVNDSIGEAYVNQHIALVRPKAKELSRWLGYFLAFENTQAQFTESNDAGAKAGLNLNAIRKIKVVIPPISELTKIVDILDQLDSSISTAEKKWNSVGKLKKALMQDLLTGKVRVTPDPE